MFKSLRSRLWLSYAAIILIVLVSFTAAITITLFSSPYIYRNTVAQMEINLTSLAAQAGQNPDASPATEAVLQTASQQNGFRYLIISPAKKVLLDTSSEPSLALLRIRVKTLLSNDAYIAGFLRDNQLHIWLFAGRKLENGNWLIATEIKPKLVLFNVLKDEVFGPLILTGTGSLFLAIFVAWLMAQQISAPLRKLARGTQMIAAGRYPQLEEKGPLEVHQLAQAFNRMSRQVQQSQQSQRDFLANVSHELKTPLTSIQGFAQAIQDGAVKDPEALQQAAGVIAVEATRMHRLVMDLLALTRLESGTADLVEEPVDLNLLLQSILDKFSLQAEKAGIKLAGELNALPETVGDGDRLVQVFSNLVDNALKYSRPGGTVILRARSANDDIFVSVVDDGIGISPEEQKRIFERFYQVDRSRKGGTGRGVGLGLAIAQQIILAHHGDIQLESAPGQGSTFIIHLPVQKSPSQVKKV